MMYEEEYTIGSEVKEILSNEVPDYKHEVTYFYYSRSGSNSYIFTVSNSCLDKFI